MLTTTEVMGRTALKNPRALARYVAQGLIDRPIIAPHPSRKGMTSYWTSATVDRVLEIRATGKRGSNRIAALTVSGDKRRNLLIEAAFVSDDPIYPSWDMTVFARTGEHPSAAERFVTAIAWRVHRVTGSKELGRRVADMVGAAGVHETALRFVRDGFSPVLLLREGDVRVVADVTLAQAVDAMGEGTLVVPLIKIVESVETNAKVRVRPTGKVLVEDDGQVVERTLSIGGSLGVYVAGDDQQRTNGGT